MKPRTRGFVAALTFCAVLSIAVMGWGFSTRSGYLGTVEPAQAAEEKSLLEKAQLEGSVTVYGALLSSVANKVAERFEKETGITVQTTRAGSEQAYGRALMEAEQGVSATDVFVTANESHLVEFKNRGLLMELEVPPGVPAQFKDEDNRYVIPWIYRYGIMYNSNLIKGDMVPKSYRELLNSRYKGKLVTGHPGYSGGVMQVTYLIRDRYGWDFFQQIAEQDPLVVQSILDVTTHIISGERPVSVSAIYFDAYRAQKEGQPVGWVFPEEGIISAVNGVGVMETAPHPNAAKLFVKWFMEKEGQQIFADLGFTAYHPEVDYPPNYLKVTKEDLQNLWKADPQKGLDPSALELIKKKWRETFGV